MSKNYHRDALYKLLKDKISEEIFGLALTLTASLIVYFGIFHKKENSSPIFLFGTVLIVLIAIIGQAYALSKSLKDYSTYVKTQSFEEITAKIETFRTERKNKNSHTYPVVHDETGAERILRVRNEKDIIKGRTYHFLYLKNTELAVMTTLIWEKDDDPYAEFQEEIED